MHIEPLDKGSDVQYLCIKEGQSVEERLINRSKELLQKPKTMMDSNEKSRISSFKNLVPDEELLEQEEKANKLDEIEKQMSIVAEGVELSQNESSVKKPEVKDIDDMVFGRISGIVKRVAKK